MFLIIPQRRQMSPLFQLSASTLIMWIILCTPTYGTFIISFSAQDHVRFFLFFGGGGGGGGRA
jgi:hypothetical protein